MRAVFSGPPDHLDRLLRVLDLLLHREILIESIELSDWTMLVETWPNGRHSFPRFTRDNPSSGPRRFVTTLKYVHASSRSGKPCRLV